MELILQSTPLNNKTIVLPDLATIKELRSTINTEFQLKNSDYYLLSNGRVLSENLNEKTLKESQISELMTISIIKRLLGGKKKKKKQYTTPKKVKKPHVDVKKIFLSQFTLQSDNSVKQTKRDCNKCGPGYFLGESKEGSFFCGNCTERRSMTV